MREKNSTYGPKPEDFSGKVFGQLTGLEFVGHDRQGARLWRWECTCGKRTIARSGSVKCGDTRSCGCLQRNLAAIRQTTHGATIGGPRGKGSAAYNSWKAMVARCTNPNLYGYKDYGGRGITVCERWRIFANFLADMGERPSGTTLGRKDNNEGYSPENCKWATGAEQSQNKRSNRMITFNDETLCITEWARRRGITFDALSYRLKYWSLERALNPPTP